MMLNPLLWSRPVQYLAIAAAALLLLFGYLKHRENRAVERDRAEAAAKANERALGAERAANRQSEAIRAANDAAEDVRRQAMKEAEDANPQDARKPAGPVSRAAADSLSRRQTATGSPSR